MAMRKLFFLLIAIAMPMAYACKEKKITFENNGETIHLTVNQLLLIELPGDENSDSSWRKIEFNNSVLINKGNGNYTLSEKNYLLEEQGVYNFRFLAINPGSSRLYMEYGNKNKPKEAPLKTFEIEVVVEKE